MRQTIAAGGIVFLTACGRDTITTPTLEPPMSFAVDGQVSDTANRRVGEARIEVMDGPQAGAMTLTDAAGTFSFGDRRFTAGLTLRASKDGYVAQSSPVSPARGSATSASAFFALPSVIPSVDLTGTYVVTMTADSACTVLPELARTRSYQATVGRSAYASTAFQGTLSGATFGIAGSSSPFTRYDSFVAVTFADFVHFYFYDLNDNDGVIEQIGPDVYVGVGGEAATIVGGSTIDIPLAGRFEYCEGPRTGTTFADCQVGPLRCTSTNHRLTISRQ